MCPIFDSSQSKSLTRYQKILKGCSFGCKNLLNFTCLTMKVHNCHHPIAPSLVLQEKLQCWPKKHYEYYFMKQKCQIQMGIAQYEIEATQLKLRGINITHLHFEMRYTLVS